MNNTNIHAKERLSLLFDDGVYNEINSLAMEKNAPAGVVTAYGYVNGNAVYAFAQDKSVNSGAVGLAQAEKITKLYELAAKTGTPVIGIHDSNGAYVDGSAESLAAYGKMLNASSVISGVVPQISIIAGTCAGSAAMIACTADFVIMTQDSELFMTPNSSCSSAKLAAKAGIASVVCDDDKKAVEKVRELINLLPVNNLAPVPMFEFSESGLAVGNTLESIVNAVCDEDTVIELSADFGISSYTALATIGGTTTAIAATNKTNAKMSKEDCMKLARFIRTCDAFSIPVVTIVDTDGLSDTDSADGIKAVTTLANSYAEATTAKIAVITGKAIGSLFIALAGNTSNSDFTYAWENAVIAPFSPLTAVEFMWHDKLADASDLTAKRNELAAEYEKTVASAVSAAQNGYIDNIIEPSQTRTVLTSALDILSGKRSHKLPKKHNNILF